MFKNKETSAQNYESQLSFIQINSNDKMWLETSVDEDLLQTSIQLLNL